MNICKFTTPGAAITFFVNSWAWISSCVSSVIGSGCWWLGMLDGGCVAAWSGCSRRCQWLLTLKLVTQELFLDLLCDLLGPCNEQWRQIKVAGSWRVSRWCKDPLSCTRQGLLDMQNWELIHIFCYRGCVSQEPEREIQFLQGLKGWFFISVTFQNISSFYLEASITSAYLSSHFSYISGEVALSFQGQFASHSLSGSVLLWEPWITLAAHFLIFLVQSWVM